jgi:putative transposase
MAERPGLRGVDLIISDQHGGLVQDIEKHFQGATWQRCQTHFLRHILDTAPKSMQDALLQEIQRILHAPNKPTTRWLLEQVLAKWEEKAPKAMQILEEGFEDATAVLDYPDRYRRRLRTTNRAERPNEEIRRRERVIRIFPNRESVYRLVGAVLIEIDEKWMSGHNYLDMADYWQWRRIKEQEAQSMNREASAIKRVR